MNWSFHRWSCCYVYHRNLIWKLPQAVRQCRQWEVGSWIGSWVGRRAQTRALWLTRNNQADPDPTGGCKVPFVFKCWALLCLYLWKIELQLSSFGFWYNVLLYLIIEDCEKYAAWMLISSLNFLFFPPRKLETRVKYKKLSFLETKDLAKCTLNSKS